MKNKKNIKRIQTEFEKIINKQKFKREFTNENKILFKKKVKRKAQRKIQKAGV